MATAHLTQQGAYFSAQVSVPVSCRQVTQFAFQNVSTREAEGVSTGSGHMTMTSLPCLALKKMDRFGIGTLG